MTLTISSFKTRCQASGPAPFSKDFLESVVRHHFAAECSRRISLLPGSSTGVIRIRHLAIHLQIAAAKLNEEALARLWVAEFLREFSRALSSGPGGKSEVALAATRADWLARFISDLLSGSARARWEYEEFRGALPLGTADCVLAVLAREPCEIVPVLMLLDDRQRFDQFLLLFDDLSLERLFSLFTPGADDETSEPTIDHLLEIGAVVAAQATTRGRLATRQRALRIFLALNKTRPAESERSLTPRIVLHALMALDALVELTQSLPPETWFSALAPESLARRERSSLHPIVLEVVAKVWSGATQMGPDLQDQKLDSLFQLLCKLSPVPVATNSAGEKSAHWISSEFAGVLLLAGLLDRLGWVQRIRISSLASRFESRAINFCLAALAVRLLSQSPKSDRLDPGLLLFAGWLEAAHVDQSGFRNFLASLTETEQENLIDLLADVEKNARDRSSDWRATFDFLASVLIREFASRVRGFRQADPAFVVKTFFAQPGRIFIDDKKVVVVLQSNPFHIALHISSMDETVESVSWLGGRRLEFQLEGL